VLNPDAAVIPARAVPGCVIGIDELRHLAGLTDKEVGGHSPERVTIAKVLNSAIKLRLPVSMVAHDEVNSLSAAPFVIVGTRQP